MNLAGKNVFLSGPMTGLKHNNVDDFARAHAIVRELGAKHVYNPAYMWLSQPLVMDDRTTHEEYMRRCVYELSRPAYGAVNVPYYEAVVFLDGWCDSPGANLEHEVAQACGIPCVFIGDLSDPLEEQDEC